MKPWRILGLLLTARARRNDRCQVVVGWCVRHVNHYWCKTHDFAWEQGDMPCAGREVSSR